VAVRVELLDDRRADEPGPTEHHHPHAQRSSGRSAGGQPTSAAAAAVRTPGGRGAWGRAATPARP
jgi:hypothetical protein